MVHPTPSICTDQNVGSDAQTRRNVAQCEELDIAALTVLDVLRMPVLRDAGSEVLAGADGLGRPVRWVHSAELADIAPLLRGGDLLLSTGIALPASPTGLTDFAESLAASDVAGLVIELGRRWTEVPGALVRACDRVDLPLVALTREVRFASVAQAVGERIVDDQLEELREAQRVHDTFTELSISEAGPAVILDAVQRLSGAAVVLESEQHQVLDYRAGPDDVSTFLSDWAARSRTVQQVGRTTWHERNGWLVTRVGKPARGWGRLVVQAPTNPPERLVAVAERAAAALALHRLHDRHRDGLLRRTHHELVLALLTDPASPEVLRRCELAGLPVEQRQLVGLSLRPRLHAGVPAPAVDDVTAATVHATHELKVPALVCEMDGDVRVLLSFPRAAQADRVVDEIATRVVRRHPVVVGAGRVARTLSEAAGSLREAQHVVQSIRTPAAGTGCPVHRLEDVHLRGLLAMLGDDERVSLFVDRELDPLRQHDAATGAGLLEALRALLTHPGSKSEAAASLHISRPAFYGRLARIERVLDVDLDDPDIRVSLHVALLADDVARKP